MTIKRNYNREYRQNHPEKVKEQRIRYLTKKISLILKEDPLFLKNGDSYNLKEYKRLARLQFKEELPQVCNICNSKEDLLIFHKKIKFPIEKENLMHLCFKCHLNERHKTKKRAK